MSTFVLPWIALIQRFGSRLFLVVLVAALVMSITDRADACSCSPMGPPAAAYSEAGAVFEGRLVDKSNSLRSRRFLHWLPWGGPLGLYTSVNWYYFEASRVWKGPRHKRFRLFSSDSCDVEFPLHIGRTYLLYALHEPEEGYQFIGATCDRILESPAKAAADLAMLGPGDTKLDDPDGGLSWWLAVVLAFLGALAFITIKFRRHARR